MEDIGKWPMLLTHVVGFLIALWILKRFAWKPISALLEERRNKIQADFDRAAADRQKSSETLTQYETKLKDIDAEGRARIQEAIKDGQKVATEIKEAAREDARNLIERAKSELSRDVDKARVQLKEDMIRMTLTATEKLIKERLDEPKHRQMIAEFIENVEKT